MESDYLMSTLTKPMKSAQDLVEHMKSKGITFNIVSPEDAVQYMEQNNNYFRVASYRKNYNKRLNSKQNPIDEYVNLDFGYLQDLAIIDMELRYTFIQLALDIEHFAKMDLLREIERHNEDGYKIVLDFLNAQKTDRKQHIQSELRQNQNSYYTKDVYTKYNPDFPAWVFLELLPFGTILDFYLFCAKRFNSKPMCDRFYIMIRCKNVRNACAHNDCFINDFHTGTAPYKTKYPVNQKLSVIPSLSPDSRKRRMQNERMQELIYVLYIHREIVTSMGVHNKAAQKLHAFKDRMMRHADYYNTNQLIAANFNFLKLVIDNWFSIV